MRPMPRLFTSLTLFVFLVGLIACTKNLVVQPGLTEFSVATPDPKLSTPKSVPPEEVAMGATSTPTIDTTATAASATIEANINSIATPDLAATATAEAERIALLVAEILTAQPTHTPDLSATMTVQVELMITLVASTLTAQPTSTPLPPPPTATASPAPPLFTATVNTRALNLRTGPGAAYPVIKSYAQDTVVTVLGKEPGEQWLKVRTPDGQVGWMARTYLQFSGRLVDIPIVEIPPAPTPTG